MAVTTYSEMTPLITLSGAELLCLSQPGVTPTPWITGTITISDLIGFINSGSVGIQPTMRQLLAAMASQSVMVTAFEQLPADITDPDNIAWNHAFRMSLTDTFTTGFLQPSIGYSDLQMIELFAFSLTFPA